MTTAATTPRQPPAALTKVFNPIARRLAGHRWFPLWAVMHHRGRKTNTAYAIPVAVLVTPTTFVIGLPWGPGTNWARNVLAAGGCTVTWKGHDVVCREPRLVGDDVATAAANRFERLLIGRGRFPAFLELQR